MKWLKTLLFVVLWGGELVTVHALDVSLTLPYASEQEVNGKKIPTVDVGEVFQLQARVSGGTRDTGNIDIDHMEGITIKGRSQATNVSVVNGNFTAEKIYTYDVMVSQKGTYTIGPARVQQNNTTVSSQPLVFQAVEAGDNPSPSKVGGQQSSPKASQKSHVIFAKLQLDKEKVVVGESVEATLHIFARGNIVDLGIEQLTVPGALVNDASEPVRSRQVIKGAEFLVYEKKYLITPSQTGQKEVGPVTIIYNVQEIAQAKNKKKGGFFGEDILDHFFRMPRIIQKKIHSDKIALSVQELPAYQGRVDGVGDFSSFSMSVHPAHVQVNEPITLTLELVGKGNLDQLPDPILRLPDTVRSYKSKATVQRTSPKSVLEGKKIFEFIVQPKQAGTLHIPAQSFTFYNSLSGYKTLHTQEATISVLAANEGALPSIPAQQTGQHSAGHEPANDAQKGGIATQPVVQQEDVHFIVERAAAGKTTVPGLPLWVIIVLIVLLPVVFYASHVTALFAIKNLPNFAKRERIKQLDGLKKELALLSDTENITGLYQLFLRFIAIKYTYPLHDLNEQVIEKLLLQKGFEEHKVHEFINYLQKCASLTFSSGYGFSSSKEDILKGAQYWLLMLDK